MKIWYYAKCDSCCEVKNVMGSNPSCTAHYLSDKDEEIQSWLSKHYACELTLIHRDDQLDKL